LETVKLIYPLLAIAGGIALGIQAVINGGLGKKVGTMEASFISFFIGTAALFFLVLFWGKGNLLAISEVPKGQLIGGLLGAFYVFIIVLIAPKIGVTATLLSVIGGQLLIGSVIDHFGLFGGHRFPLDAKKIIALLLMFGSIYLFNQK
jgi:bacterial/archaeal transporter family-2 protein